MSETGVGAVRVREENPGNGGLSAKNESNYWDGFYKLGRVRRTPSRFARLIDAYFSNPGTLVEFGCGDGTDAELFAEAGWRVFASDASKEAIELAQHRLARDSVYVEEVNALSDRCTTFLKEAFARTADTGLPRVIYTRFFLHSLNDTGLERFLDRLAKAEENKFFFVAEFRVDADEPLPKTFNNHYRRYRSLTTVLQMLNSKLSAQTVSAKQSKGFAPFGDEDPVIGRVIVHRGES